MNLRWHGNAVHGAKIEIKVEGAQDSNMKNNDILRRLRYSFDFDDTKMIAIFGLSDLQVTRDQANAWLKKEDDPDFMELSDTQLARFLNGLIIDRRGKKDGAQPQPEQSLTNNIVFMKLKIALNLQADAVLGILLLADFRLSKHELSALFRKPGHKHYRECQDQLLRNFLNGLQIKYRGTAEAKPNLL